MSSLLPEVVPASGQVWRVGHAPDLWAWTAWEYATDSGLFGGRWDDQDGQFRTLYTSGSLLGCLLELLAAFRPSFAVMKALANVEDDDGTAAEYPSTPAGTVGHRWLEGRLFGSAQISGRYLYVTHSRTLAALASSFPFARHGIDPVDADAALLKDARDRSLTRSVARWAYDLRGPDGGPIDGIRFNSRWGDEVPLWAAFERAADGSRSRHLVPVERAAHAAPGDSSPLTRRATRRACPAAIRSTGA